MVLNDIFDDKTMLAVKIFQLQYFSQVYSIPLNKQFTGEVNAATWAMIGRAIYKVFGVSRLMAELRAAGNDNELRSLLLGMDQVNRVYKGFYTSEMEACDKKIASIFGGSNAVASANGFDPDSLAIIGITLTGMYSYFRGDTYEPQKDGSKVIGPGHLSVHAMHLYGSTDGTRFGVDGNTYTDLYIPDGFRESKSRPFKFSRIPGPKAASLDFYYNKLGNYEDVTLMVSHIKDFKITNEGNRWRIGKIGGNGGEPRNYVHSHFDLFKGDVGMTGKRIRIPFAKTFC